MLRMKAQLTALPLMLVLLAATAVGQEPRLEPRLEALHPVVGETMSVIVDRLPPRVSVALRFNEVVSDSDRLLAPQLGRADASGCARFEFNVPDALAGSSWNLLATYQAGDQGSGRTETVGPVQVRFQRPPLLVTGVADGASAFSRLELTGQPDQPFRIIETWSFGSTVPGGSVRDGRGTRTFVVTDAAGGVIRILRDSELGGGEIGTLALAGDIRGLAVTPDGSRILVASAGVTSDPVLTVLDTTTDDEAAMILDTLPIEPLGPNGGKVVISDDGLRAFVSVRGLYLREINLLRMEPGRLINVGSAGQDEIRDLRIVDGFLFALTGRSDQVHYLTGLEVGNLANLAQEGPTLLSANIGVGSRSGRSSVLLLDGEQGQITIIDARTMRRQVRPVAIRPGANALLLTPDPTRESGALLYSAPGGGSLAVPIEFERFTTGVAGRLPFAARAVAVTGSCEQVDWMFVSDPDGRLIAIQPDSMQPFPLDLPFRVVELSVAH